MQKSPVIHQVADHVSDWLKKEAWLERWDNYQAGILERLAIKHQLTVDQLKEKFSSGINKFYFIGTLFEHFVSKRFKDSPDNIINDYLQRRGWKESKKGKVYLEQLRDVAFSLYEVVDVDFGKSVTLQDLIRPLPPTEVLEVSGSQQIKPFDRMIAKVLYLEGERRFSGSMGQAHAHEQDALVARFKSELQAQGLTLLPENYVKEEKAINDFLHAHGEALQQATLDYLVSPIPPMVTMEGHSLLPTEIHIPVYDRKLVIQTLDKHPQFLEDGEDEDGIRVWNWIAAPDDLSEINSCFPGLVIKSDIMLPEGEVFSCRGTVELKPDNQLYCTCLSKERGELLLEMLLSLLGKAIGQAVITYQPVDNVMTSDSTTKRIKPVFTKNQRELASEYIKQHYRTLLKIETPSLNDKTPLDAVKEEPELVVKWLRKLEIITSQKAQNDQVDCDFGWMWQELGLEHLRPTESRERSLVLTT